MNEGAIQNLRIGLETRISELMQEWQLDSSLFWSEHPEITMQPAPFHFDGGPFLGSMAMAMVTISEHERALRSIATHVMDGRGFEWSIDMMTGGNGYFWIGAYNGADDVRRD